MNLTEISKEENCNVTGKSRVPTRDVITLSLKHGITEKLVTNAQTYYDGS
jgi:hypothetical protein